MMLAKSIRITLPCTAGLLGLLLFPAGTTAGERVEPSAQRAEITAAEEAAFARVVEIARRFTVRVDTVGGVPPGGDQAQRRPAAPPSGAPAPALPPPQFRGDPGSDFLLADGPTTGLIWSADGLILTSSFNFVRDPAVITATLPDGRQLRARLLGRDQVRKLAVLKVDAEGLPVPEWVPPGQVRCGQWALAVGRGPGGPEPVVSVGIISAGERMSGYALQTDARLSPANYGGPLLDLDGRVLGVCVPLAQRPGELAGIELYDSGIGFAIPAARVAEIAPRLSRGESFVRGWLGMQMDPADETGQRILRLADPSPLRAAGARSGDRIVEIHGRPVYQFGHVVNALAILAAGDTVQVRLLRGADFLDLSLTLARSDELGALPSLEQPAQPAPRPEPQPD